MTSKLSSADLFGGLSDSDSSDNEDRIENERASATVFQDLEMSSEEELGHEDTQPMELSPSPESISLEEYRYNRNESNRSENGYSTSFLSASTSSSHSSYYEHTGIPNTSIEMIGENAENSVDNQDRRNIEDPIPDSTEEIKVEESAIPPPIHQIQVQRHEALQKANAPSHFMMSKPSDSFTQRKFPTRNNSSLTDEELEEKLLAEKIKEQEILSDIVLIANFSTEQLDRYAAFRRSKFNKPAVKNIIAQATGSAVSDPLALAVGGLAKLFVGELVEEAVELRDASNEENRPVQPHHIIAAFNKLNQDGKLWPPYGKKF
ncbi:CRE-TAF-11.3 protein [Caenorhabditis remanei]|uniref:Transcription initiation factor TFIID subunit 11 n=1 Tax=Caenorhabditis remanei TaxID=31234 RepID=E3LZD0_CAERE|nr:CRE-TAF-11.3 protein [Caenorhabditis remanei]